MVEESNYRNSKMIELNRSSDESIQSIKDEKWIKAEILIKAHFIDVDDS